MARQAHAHDRQPERVGRDVILADGTQRQSAAAAAQEPQDRERHREREVHERVLAEDELPHQRKVAEPGNMDGRDRLALGSHEACADQAGEAKAEDREREAGCDLVRREPQDEEREQGREHQPRRDRAGHAYDRGAGQDRRCEPAGRPHRHHALDAEVEDARLLDDEFAQGRDQQRRRRRDDGHEDCFPDAHRVRPSPSQRCGRGRRRAHPPPARTSAIFPGRSASGRAAASARSARSLRRSR